MLGVLCSVHLEVQYKGRNGPPTLGSVELTWASVPGAKGRHGRSRSSVPAAPIAPARGRHGAGRG